MKESRKTEIIINVENITTSQQLQTVLMEGLDFPDFYGKNWDAFWDAITGLVELPENIIFENWKKLENGLPEESSILKRLLNEYNKENPEDDWKTRVLYD